MVAVLLHRPREPAVALSQHRCASQPLGHERKWRQSTAMANASGALVRERKKQEAAILSAMLDKTYLT